MAFLNMADAGKNSETKFLRLKYPFFIFSKRLHVRAIALYPFMIFRERSYCFDKVMMNHELIHHRQQLELLIIPFYVIYLLNYLINLLRYLNHYKAYRNIIFEREAYANEENLDYRAKRKWWGFLEYWRSER